jgi:phage shock protein PspC (stress-responsive transcriptional regulator)
MMEKTIKINLGGVLFQIDEEAYRILKKYLSDIDIRLRHTQGGAETLEDIESRISEIFSSQSPKTGIISKENVEEVMSVIGSPETFETVGEHNETGGHYSVQPVRKKMYRNPDDKIIGGVSSGMGEYLDIEPVWMRVLFIIFTCFFGIGFLVYIALWIALPEARTDAQKKEMYGDNPRPSRHYDRNSAGIVSSEASGYSSGAGSASNVGNAFNEVFRAVGNVLFVIVRIFLIMIGVVFVLGGFFTLVTVIMVFFFRYPDYFSTYSHGINFFYFPEFLNYVVTPAAAPWIIALTFIILALPLIALIYWGVKMIFWFKARDGVVSLIALTVWAGSIAALTMILFNEGISYSDTSKSLSSNLISHAPENLYVVSDHRISDLKFDKEISLPDDEYSIYFTDDNRNLFIGTRLFFNQSDDKSARIDVIKRSTGRSRIDASKKAESLLYNYRLSNDTIFLDDYFSVPAGTKWSADNVGVNIFIPAGTKVHFDKATENMFRRHHHETEEWMEGPESVTEYDRSSAGDHYWVMTGEGLKMDRSVEKK